MKKTICITILIALVSLSGCSVSETNSTKQKVTEPNTTQAVTTLCMSNSKSEKTKSSKITNTNTKAKKDKTSKKKYKNYKDIPGYIEYISDRNKGEITSFCCMCSSLYLSEKARTYYKKNIRKAGNFLVTNYLDGICINKVINRKKWDGKIPEKIEGLPVIKLGSYYFYYERNVPESLNVLSFASEKKIYSHYSLVYLPKTIKYIDYQNLNISRIRHRYIVNKNNPYYKADDDGWLYVIDQKGKKLDAYTQDEEM